MPGVEAIKSALFQDSSLTIYAVIDGASSPSLLTRLVIHRAEHVCLFRGELPADLQQTAPYLVRLERDAPFADWVLSEGWGSHWGILALADAPLVSMRKHFRTFLMVKRYDGMSMYFRYYDPRVFRAFLPTCSPAQLKILFGPISSYLVEDRDPARLLRFTPENPEGEPISLDKPMAAAAGGR